MELVSKSPLLLKKLLKKEASRHKLCALEFPSVEPHAPGRVRVIQGRLGDGHTCLRRNVRQKRHSCRDHALPGAALRRHLGTLHHRRRRRRLPAVLPLASDAAEAACRAGHAGRLAQAVRRADAAVVVHVVERVRVLAPADLRLAVCEGAAVAEAARKPGRPAAAHLRPELRRLDGGRTLRAGAGGGGVGDDASLASPKWSERGPPPGFPQIVDTTDNDDGLMCDFRNHLVSGITELSGHYCNTSSDSEYQYGQEAFQRALERREKEREALLAEEARARKVRMQNAMSQLLAILPATEDTRSETVLTRACEYIRQLTESVTSAHVDNVKLKQRIEQLTSPPQQQQPQQQQHHSSSSSSARRKSDAAHRRSHA
eukprot:Rhum_TRINITY_DN14800_c20_g1::Rhum_TRINITY_DN14800_c20_g1_i1::g.121388::m.121388